MITSPPSLKVNSTLPSWMSSRVIYHLPGHFPSFLINIWYLIHNLTLYPKSCHHRSCFLQRLKFCGSPTQHPVISPSKCSKFQILLFHATSTVSYLPTLWIQTQSSLGLFYSVVSNSDIALCLCLLVLVLSDSYYNLTDSLTTF